MVKFFFQKISKISLLKQKAVTKIIPAAKVNNSNFVRPNPGIASNFLEGLRKLWGFFGVKRLRLKLLSQLSRLLLAYD